MNATIKAYTTLFGALAVTLCISLFAPTIFSWFSHSSDSELLLTFFAISVLFLLSFTIHFCSNRVHFPSFVIAIFFGIAAHPLLLPIVFHHTILNIIVGIGATLILFGGGLETPFQSFKKLLPKIASVSFVGLSLTAILFSFGVSILGNALGAQLSISVTVLLGAILASTDPAAIIPVLKSLRFKNQQTKNLIISESAVTDVTGTLLTIAFLGVVVAGQVFESVGGAYRLLFTPEVGSILFEEMLYGILFGLVGWGLLLLLTRTIEHHGNEAESHAAYFLFVPLVIFTLAVSFHGSGYLAAFVAGLLFVLSKRLHETENFFNYTIEGFFKPTIFLLLGALVDIPDLLSYAGIGVLASLLFMFIIRPIAVFLTLGPFSFFGKERLTLKELLFISFVRETGAIPAVLLIAVSSTGIVGLDGLVPIGMWVILATLVIEPPLTPFIAKWLGVAEPIADATELELSKGTIPFVVLGSRGHSFMDRLPFVVDWASRHHIYRIVLLHCPEDKYTPEFAKEVGEQARVVFDQINRKKEAVGETVVDFEYISRTGFLQDNIDAIAKEDDQVTAVFVGRKALDYRLDQVCSLRVPLFFLD